MQFINPPQMCWIGSPDEVRRLTAEYSYVWKQIQVWAQTSTVTINGNTYRGHALTG